ncbi:MAG: methyltransferase domain-containing protein [Ferruginibacter sp.]|nr:methyltransferase domain-containing protein [Ferruginibacter sp.]
MKYLLYLIYLTRHWNLSIARHILIQDIKGWRKYGISTAGFDRLSSLSKKGIDLSHSSFYMPASYDLLALIFEYLAPKNIQHLIDLGCGKGRSLCVAAHYKIPKLTGVDISENLLRNAKRNLTHTCKLIQPPPVFHLILNDAFYYPIANSCDAIILYNPFDEVILSGVLNNIIESLNKHPRTLYIIYVSPVHYQLIESSGFKKIFHYRQKEFLEVIIFCNSK